MSPKPSAPIQTCDGTLTLVPDRRELELALPLIPNAPGLVSLALSTEFATWLRQRGLSVPRTTWKFQDLQRLRTAMSAQGYDAGVAPFPLVPLPSAFLTAEAAVEQQAALAELDALKIKPTTVLPSRLVQRLHLVALNGRARIDLLNEYGAEIDRVERVEGSDEESESECEEGVRGGRKRKAGAAGATRSGGARSRKRRKGKCRKNATSRTKGVSSLRVVVYSAAVFDRPLLFRDIVVQDDLRLAYPSIDRIPTLRSTVLEHAAARDAGSGLHTPVAKVEMLGPAVWEGMRNRGAALEYSALFASSSAFSSTFGSATPTDLRRFFGRDFASASLLISYELRSLDTFLSTISDQLSSPLSLDATLLLLEILAQSPRALPHSTSPIFSPAPLYPQPDFPDPPPPPARPSPSERRNALADLIRDTRVECEGVQGTPTLTKTTKVLSSRLKSGYAVEPYSDLWPADRFEVKLGMAWIQLQEVEDVLRSWRALGLPEPTEEDSPVLDAFVTLLSSSVLTPPEEAARTSCHAEPPRGPFLGASIENWESLVLGPLLSFLVEGINRVLPVKDRLDSEHVDNASLEEILYALYYPRQSRSLFRRSTGLEERKLWLVDAAFAAEASQIARWTYANRYRFISVYLTCSVLGADKSSIFGDSRSPTIIPISSDPPAHCIWQYSPYLTLLDRLSSLTPSTFAASTPFDFTAAMSTFRGSNDADAGEQQLPVPAVYIERFIASEANLGFHSGVVEVRGHKEIKRLLAESKRSLQGERMRELRDEGQASAAAAQKKQRDDIRKDQAVSLAPKGMERPKRTALADRTNVKGKSRRFGPSSPSPPTSPARPASPTAGIQASTAPEPTPEHPSSPTARLSTSTEEHPPPSSAATSSPVSALTLAPTSSTAMTSTPPSPSSTSADGEPVSDSAREDEAEQLRKEAEAHELSQQLQLRMSEWSAHTGFMFPSFNVRLPLAFILLPAFADYILSSRTSSAMASPASDSPKNASLDTSLDQLSDSQYLSHLATCTVSKAVAVLAFFNSHAPLSTRDYICTAMPASIKPPVAAPLILALGAGLGDLAASPSLPPNLAALRLHLSQIAETLTATGRVTASMSADWAEIVELRELERGRQGKLSQAGETRLKRQAKARACKTAVDTSS
ncbi:hypothetical protein NBRC10512_004676 [Rhodotorula toruloides]|uniref:RHTO0S09e01266g1_1 n=2 Tax=Rhodotorula toruloides TaxID=5286 RepID=A0A061B406_RHOTO|nr:uncharacterized protein RHTO_07874 [Rhodotorula toruloides NP11]EMS23003.1 hypothetical protein RHTO_07874 [Rhodotorula toruloides NP11]CDR44213.1 RHTO0S09e01266g1_1 [Rhodotorula toruloides]